MDKFDHVRALREVYESALDEMAQHRDAYHREVTKLYRSGVTLRDIADALGLSHQRVHQIVGVEEDSPRSRRRSAGIAGAVILLALVSGFGYVLFAEPSDPSMESSTKAAPNERTERAAVLCFVGDRGQDTSRSGFRTTISPSIQAAAQESLYWYGPGFAALLNPRTGHVLAVSNLDPCSLFKVLGSQFISERPLLPASSPIS